MQFNPCFVRREAPLDPGLGRMAAGFNCTLSNGFDVRINGSG